MNQNLKHFLFWVSIGLPVTSIAQTPQTINLSTGWNNGVVTNNNVVEDTWHVTLPSNTAGVLRTCFLSAWQETGTSRWVSSNVTATGAAFEFPEEGTYTYDANFTVNAGSIECARLVINNIGADNRITELNINGLYNYPLTLPAGNNHFNPMPANISIPINSAHLNPGVNAIIIRTSNVDIYTGFNFNAELRVNEVMNILPVVTGPSAICQGNPLTFGGSLAPGSTTSNAHQWKLLECDANGNLVPGGYTWDSWYYGAPAAVTFPSNVPCGKYYMAVLAAVLESECENWAQDTHVFYYSCRPIANAGPDKTVCQDQCVNIGPTGKIPFGSYNWTANGSTVGYQSNITVCPAGTTTYTFTIMNQYGCSSSDQMVVTVLPNDPGFDITTNTDLPQYYTIIGEPNVMNANLVAGFGQFWAVEELDVNGNSLYVIQNPSAWYPYPASCAFKGFDDYLVNYDVQPNVTDVYTTVPTTPASGRFMYNRTYRITRGTWNNNCTWNADAFMLTRTKSGNDNGVSVYPTEAPDFSSQFAAMQEEAANLWNISPNPSNGIFTISSEEMEGSTVEVYDLFGKKIAQPVIEAGKTVFQLDLSGHAKGVYILNITTGGMMKTHKIVLE